MVNGQRGEISAYDSEDNVVSGVFNTSGPDIQFPSNETLILDFDESQNVTSVTFSVLSNVKLVLIQYFDGENIVVSKNIMTCLCRQLA